ncbi:hypothetical protein BJY52DRAFT_1190871 [Lactarius psammicola]|nr:hypothetical protein BJY52DRAFT_1190871 [Lactarius psammicola]
MSSVVTPPEPIKEIPSQVVTLDSTQGVASSMHNPSNAMDDDLPMPGLSMAPAQEVPPPLPQLASIPLLPGLAEMLNTLQANLVTSFISQINGLSKRIDDQDIVIKSILSGQGTVKSKAKRPENVNPGPPTSRGSAPALAPNPSAGSAGPKMDAPPTAPIPVPDPTPASIPPP